MNIKTFGFEKEFFVLDKNGKYTLVTSEIACDECHWLAEARGEPHAYPLHAKHLLNAATELLHASASKHGMVLVDKALAPDFPKELLRLAHRKYGKNASHSYFAHGGCYKHSIPRAGLHVHFGNARDIMHDGQKVATVEDTVNVPRIIWMLDNAFRSEIKEAKRVPGEYEFKRWGFEYRSLPSTVSLDKLVDVLYTIQAD